MTHGRCLFEPTLGKNKQTNKQTNTPTTPTTSKQERTRKTNTINNTSYNFVDEFAN